MIVLPEVIGESPALVALRQEISRLLQEQVGGRTLPPILIQGETGDGQGASGHRAGPRR